MWTIKNALVGSFEYTELIKSLFMTLNPSSKETISYILPWIGINASIIISAWGYPKHVSKLRLKGTIKACLLIMMLIAVKSNSILLGLGVVAAWISSNKIKMTPKKIILLHGLLTAGGIISLLYPYLP